MRLLLRVQKTRQPRIRLQLMALAVAFYSFYPLVNAPVARAAGTPGAVVINEFSSFGSADWVELYNTTASPVVLAGWTLKSNAGPETTLSGGIAPHGFFVAELGGMLDDAGDTIYLSDETAAPIEDASYGTAGGVAVPGLGQSTARTTDGGVAWATDAPTKGTTNAPVDVTPPGTPMSGSPNGVWRPSSFTFEWESVKGANGYEFRIAKGGEPTDLSWKSEILGTSSYSFADVPGHGEGVWYWQARALDQVKNPSAWSEVWSVSVDETLPSVAMSEPSGTMYGGPSSQQVPIMASIQDDHLSSVQVLLDGAVIQESVQSLVSIVLEASNLVEGGHAVMVRAVDLAGNTVEVSRMFTVDTQAPVLSTSVVMNQIFKGVVELDLDGTDTHPKNYAITVLTKNGAVVAPAENERSGDGEESAKPETQSQHTLTYNWDTTAVADGTYIIRFSGEDEAGNMSAVERTVMVDNIIETDFGLGGIPINDPLLEELSVALKQPFATPQAVLFSLQRPAMSVLQNVDERVVGNNSEENAAGAGVNDIAVAATEGGWRVWGILWYWWLLLLALAALVIYRMWQVVQSYRMAGEVEAS